MELWKKIWRCFIPNGQSKFLTEKIVILVDRLKIKSNVYYFYLIVLGYVHISLVLSHTWGICKHHTMWCRKLGQFVAKTTFFCMRNCWQKAGYVKSPFTLYYIVHTKGHKPFETSTTITFKNTFQFE